jgi:hypothetical protein
MMSSSGDHQTLEASTVSIPLGQSETYETPTQLAHRLGKHPSAPVRWLTKGAILSTGQRLKLQAVRTPGGWLIRRDWCDAFLAALTADRQGSAVTASEAAGGSNHKATDRRRLAALDAGLAQAGF